MKTELAKWIWLAEALGPSSPVCARLCSSLGDIHAVYAADRATLSETGLLNERQLGLLCNKNTDTAERIEAYCVSHDVGVLTLQSAAYPRRLAGIAAPPVVLYYKGKLPYLDMQLCISVVGTRAMSDYGRRMAYRLGYELGGCGAVVVSGMALGIDGMAHQGALDAGAHTIAVLGCGLDRVYPAAHLELQRVIAKNGTVMTEYAPGTAPSGYHFPARNRIISGLCQGTVVVEASEKSGALITAEHAVRQGRELFAIPADMDKPAFIGNNTLIREGARIVTAPGDILTYYEPFYQKTADVSRMKVPGFYDLYRDAPRYGSDRAVTRGEEKRAGAVPAYRHSYAAAAERMAQTPPPAERMAQTPPPAEPTHTEPPTAVQSPSERQPRYREAPPQLDPLAKAVLAAITRGTTTDEIIDKTQLDVRVVRVQLTELHMNGLICSEIGDRVSRVPE